MASAASPAPSGSMRHEFTQCQNCWISKAPGVTFSRCSRCKVDIYCSRACQKAAWKLHKGKCQLNSRVQAHGSLELEEKLKKLRTFTSKHRPTLCDCAMRALDLGTHVENAERAFFRVSVRERPGATKAELAFIAEEASAQPYSSLPAWMAEEMLSVRAEINKTQVEQEGLDGTFFMVLIDMDSGAQNNVPVGFAREAMSKSSTPVHETVLKNLNNGIVM